MISGYVVVLFGRAADGWCTLGKCPMSPVEWFPTEEAARAYADWVPQGFEPHILHISTYAHEKALTRDSTGTRG